ncbi:hypothetical protein ACRYCC_38340 [Actinomadura scrupuli]
MTTDLPEGTACRPTVQSTYREVAGQCRAYSLRRRNVPRPSIAVAER